MYVVNGMVVDGNDMYDEVYTLIVTPNWELVKKTIREDFKQRFEQSEFILDEEALDDDDNPSWAVVAVKTNIGSYIVYKYDVMSHDVVES